MSENEGPDLVPIGREREADEAPEELRRLIVFQACDEWFSLPIEWVREIQPLQRVTRVPNAPPEVVGVVNLRGRILTLFDLAGCLVIPPGGQPNMHVVVLDLSDLDLCVGIVAQHIARVREVAASVVDSTAGDMGAGGMEGVFEMGGQVVGLLDLSRVFARALQEWGVKAEPRGVR